MSSHNFDNVLRTLVQASGSNTGKLRTDADRASFQVNTKVDFAALFHQHNALIYPLLLALRSGPEEDDALDLGLEGRTVTTFGAATSNAATCYWDPTNKRPRSIKETIDCLIAELARIENVFSLQTELSDYDDSGLLAMIACLTLNDTQLSKDILGPQYTLDCDGNSDLPYSLARHIDEFMTQLVNGYPGAGLTFAGEAAYPSLSLTVRLSQVIIDATLPASTIESTSGPGLLLTDDLAAIRTFVGMDDATDSTPDYSAHGVIATVSDGDSLELSIQKLDLALSTVGTDEKVGVSVNDTTPGYLLDKLTTTTTAVSLTEINDGGDEDLQIDVADLVGDAGAGGTHGLVPAPGAGDAASGKYLDADGTWTVPTGTQPDLVMDYTTIYPGDMQAHQDHPHSIPVLDKLVKGATVDIMTATKMMVFPGSEDHYLSFPVPVPRNSSGDNPTSFVVWIASMMHAAGGGSLGLVWEAEYALSGGVAHITEDGEAYEINGGTGWAGTDKIVTASHASNIEITEFGSQNIEGTTKTGHLHVKLGRLGTDGSDTFTGDQGMMYAQVEWTW